MNTDYSVTARYLRCTEGTSDKVYNMSINAVGRRYKIVAEYGRTDAVLKQIDKGEFHSLQAAQEEFDKLLAEKYNKGYIGITAEGEGQVERLNRRARRDKEDARRMQIRKNEEDGIRKIEFDL